MKLQFFTLATVFACAGPPPVRVPAVVPVSAPVQPFTPPPPVVAEPMHLVCPPGEDGSYAAQAREGNSVRTITGHGNGATISVQPAPGPALKCGPR